MPMSDHCANKFIIGEPEDPQFTITMTGDIRALDSIPGLQFKIAGIPGVTGVTSSPTDADQLVVKYQANMPDVRYRVRRVISDLIVATNNLPYCMAVLTEDQ